MTMSMIELKPCPFCGGEAKMFAPRIFGEWQGYHYVACQTCHASTSGIMGGPEGGKAKTEKEAAAAWNRRAPDPSQREAKSNGMDETTTHKPKLRPCPFCGKEPKVIRLAGSYGYYSERYVVRCQTQNLGGKNTCPCYGSEYNKFLPGERATEDEAIETWNKRATICQK